MREVIEQGKARLAEGEWIVIFPEGTRMPPGETRKYGISGALLAAETGKLIVPVAHDAGYYWPRRGLLQETRHDPRRHRPADRGRRPQSARGQRRGAGMDRTALHSLARCGTVAGGCTLKRTPVGKCVPGMSLRPITPALIANHLRRGNIMSSDGRIIM